MSAEDKKNDKADEPEAADTEKSQTDTAAASTSVPDTDGVDRTSDKSGETNEASTRDAEPESVVPEAPEAAHEPTESVTAVQNAPARADGFARFIAVLALLVAVAVLALSQFPQVPQGSAAKLAAVEGRVADLAGQPASTGTVGTDDLRPAVAELRMSLASIEDRLANLSLLIDETRTTQEKLAAQSKTEPVASADTDLEEQIVALAARVEALAERPEPATTAVSAQPTAPANSPQVAELETKLSALNEELAAMKLELARVEGLQADLSGAIGAGDEGVREEMRAALDAASTTLTAQMSSVAAAAQATNDATNNQVVGKAALVLAAGRLKDAASRSAPFSGAWQAVEALGISGDNHPDIARVAPTGVPTLTELQMLFANEASQAIVADKVGEGDGWVDGALKRMGSLVKVRRTGELEGDEVEAVIARAEVRLSEDNLAGAIEELQALQGAAAAEMSSWIGDARRRLALDGAIDALQSSLLAGLAGNN